METSRARLTEQLAQLREQYASAQADHAARLEVIEKQRHALARLARERDQLQSRWTALKEQSESAEQELATQREVVEGLERRLIELEAARNALVALCATLREQLRASEAGRGATMARVEQVEKALMGSEADRAAGLARIDQLEELLARSEAQRLELASQRTSAQGEVRAFKAALEAVQRIVRRLPGSYVYRLMRSVGLWGWLEPAVRPDTAPTRAESRPSPGQGRELRQVVVDLTPILPGGENGGAKVMTIELLRHLSQLAPDCQFTLLTSARSHEELSILDARNMRRLCVTPRANPWLFGAAARAASRLWVRGKVSEHLPKSVMAVLEKAFQGWVGRPVSGNLPRQLGADLLFCPFTAPFFFDPTVPVISVIYDLQYHDYPQFFEPAERESRERHFLQACSAASKLVCISEHVRQTVVKNSNLSPERVQTIHISLPHRLDKVSDANVEQVLGRHQLDANGFLLYPANFWAHKNHELLLASFGIYCARHPESELKLVLTGAPGPRMEYLGSAAARMRLGTRVVFAGFLPDEEFTGLMRSCRAVIFPSLYEGFGMPVLEAMAAGKPVLCSNLTSLPEVTGDAALLFDPRKSAEIVAAIERLESDPDYVQTLVERGKRRAAEFGDATGMAGRYLEVFRGVLRSPAPFAPGLHGVYPDGWTGERVVITFDQGSELRKLAVELAAAPWIPVASVSIRVLPDLDGSPEIHCVPRGQSMTVEREIPTGSGFLELIFHPLFQPRACGLGNDERWLGCRFLTGRIILPDGVATSLLVASHDL